MDDRVISPKKHPQDEQVIDYAQRPRGFHEFVGQKALVQNLSVFTEAARMRGDAMDHVLFCGPPGLGKTALSYIVARELDVSIRATSGPAIVRPGDLAALLTNLGPRDVLFIDEIHRLPIAVEEILYPAMEDRRIDIMIGEGPHVRAVQLNLSPFTLIGATTRSGLLSSPFRDRFGAILSLEFYTPEEISEILARAAIRQGIILEPAGAHEIACRCRGTPRIALRLLRRMRDFAEVRGASCVTLSVVQDALVSLNITAEGLDPLDQRYMGMLADAFNGGPVGIETLAAALSEAKDTLEDVVEPYLLQRGFIQRTARGRILTERGAALFGRPFDPR